MLRPGSGYTLITLGQCEINLNPGRMQESLVEEFFGSFCLLFVLEADEAELPRSVVLKHDFCVSDLSTMSFKVVCQVDLFQVLGNVFYDETRHFFTFYFILSRLI